jgi:predicted peptidase
MKYIYNNFMRALAEVACVSAVVIFAGGFRPYGTNELVSLTVPGVHESVGDAGFKYRIFVPDIPESATNGVPLVLFLHGSGECGTNNVEQLKHGVGGLVWWSRKKAPAIVVAPQAPPMTVWSPVFFNSLRARMPYKAPAMIKSLKRFVDGLCEKYPVDTNRLLVTGISLGAYGVWDMVARYPGFFAAAIPVCGAGDPQRAEEAAKTPLWIFHGERDVNVPNKIDREMVGRLWELDAPVRYCEYPDAGHGIWGRVYSDDTVMKWFFSRTKEKPVSRSGRGR